MSNRNFVIIGNGFDLAHGLETKWSDFDDYMYQFNGELYDLLGGCARSDLWSDFEKGLGELDLERIYRNELTDFDIIRNDEDDGRNHQMADRIRYVEDSLIDEMKRTLNNWILSVDASAEPFECIKEILECADVISFNYTSTLESIYGFSTDNIVYLHGKAVVLPNSEMHDYSEPEPVPELVIGHGKDVEPIDVGSFAYSMSDEIVLDEVETEGHRNVLCELKKDTMLYLSRLNRFLESMEQYDRIYIVGHSMSDIDAPYFKVIASYVRSDAKIFATYKPEFEDLENKRMRVRDFFSENEIIVKEIQDL